MRKSSWVILSLVAIMTIVLLLMANRLGQIKRPTSAPAPIMTESGRP
jgi:hypothetical protein